MSILYLIVEQVFSDVESSAAAVLQAVLEVAEDVPEEAADVLVDCAAAEESGVDQSLYSQLNF